MDVTLAEILALPNVAATRPAVLAGPAPEDCRVAWVHTSELLEVAPLLRGGEALLIAGAAFTGVEAARFERYVDELADQGAAALCFELGRTFPEVPGEVVAACERRGLTLVELRGVVPFVDVTRSAHSLIVNRSLEQLRRRDEVGQMLERGFLGGAGTDGLLRLAAEAIGGPARLRRNGDTTVAGTVEDTAFGEPVLSRAVEVGGRPWGHLEFAVAPPHADDVLDRASFYLAMSLALSTVGGADTPQALLEKLIKGTGPAAELGARLVELGQFGDDVSLLPVALSADARTSVTALAEAVDAGAWQILGPNVVASSTEEVVVVAAVEPTDNEALRVRVERLVGAVDRMLSTSKGGHVFAASAGTPVRDPKWLGEAIGVAQEARLLLHRFPLGQQVALVGDTSMVRLLHRVWDDKALETYVIEQLGRVLETDATQGTDLRGVLEAYLESLGSKTATAERLGIGRQTLYARLDHLERLLGGTLKDPDLRMSLWLALVVWRLRKVGGAGPEMLGR